jgi:DNA-binding response OmpR family regulator
VDDEVDFLFSASIALRRAGFRVKVSDNGREALVMILEAHKNKTPFDLLITDIRMPGMSGFELIDAVKRSGILTPFFAMTCFSDGDLIRELGGKGCNEVIEKPFQPEELVKRIRGILDSFRQAVS